MPRYIFVMDTGSRAFPERYRVVRPDEDAVELVAAEDLTGSVPAAEADAFFDALCERFPPDAPCVVEEARATRWATIERSFYGMWRTNE